MRRRVTSARPPSALVVMGTKGWYARYRVQAIAVDYRDGRHTGYGFHTRRYGKRRSSSR